MAILAKHQGERGRRKKIVHRLQAEMASSPGRGTCLNERRQRCEPDQLRLLESFGGEGKGSLCLPTQVPIDRDCMGVFKGKDKHRSVSIHGQIGKI